MTYLFSKHYGRPMFSKRATQNKTKHCSTSVI